MSKEVMKLGLEAICTAEAVLLSMGMESSDAYQEAVFAINTLKEALTKQSAQLEPFEYWNAVDGWVMVEPEEVFDGRAASRMMHAAMKMTDPQYRDDPECMFAMGWDSGFNQRTQRPKRKPLTNKENT